MRGKCFTNMYTANIHLNNWNTLKNFVWKPPTVVFSIFATSFSPDNFRRVAFSLVFSTSYFRRVIFNELHWASCFRQVFRIPKNNTVRKVLKQKNFSNLVGSSRSVIHNETEGIAVVVSKHARRSSKLREHRNDGEQVVSRVVNGKLVHDSPRVVVYELLIFQLLKNMHNSI